MMPPKNRIGERQPTGKDAPAGHPHDEELRRIETAFSSGMPTTG
jgi:hypothetical protein